MGNSDLLKLKKFFLVVLALVIGGGSLSGCTSLRKKFTRKSKAKERSEDFIPVLQPVEYKKAELSPFEKYREQHTMARAYLTDIVEIMGLARAGDKQQVYALNQFSARLQVMADLLSHQKKVDLEKLIAKVGEIVREYDKPAPMRRYDILKGSVRDVEKTFRKEFKPDMVRDGLKAQ